MSTRLSRENDQTLMKICFNASTFPARSQTFVTMQALYAVRAGHEVIVACRDREPDDFLTDIDRKTLERVTKVLWPPVPQRAFAALPNALKNRAAAWFAKQSWRRRIDADVVVSHFGYCGAHVERAQRGWADRPPLVTIYHGRDVTVEKQRNHLTKYRDLFARGDLHLAVNEPFARMLIEAGAPPERVETHHLGVPVARYPFSPRRIGQSIRLLCVCRMVEKKGLSVALEALKHLSREHPKIDWKFEIGGDGPLESALRRQVVETGIQDRVHFLGPLSHAETLTRIAEADCFLLPSITAADGDQEGIPVTLMEAMALGTPVCTTRHSGIPELVKHGETGLLSKERDAEALSANIRALASREVDAFALAQAARLKVERDFDEDAQNNALIERCRRLIREGPKRS